VSNLKGASLNWPIAHTAAVARANLEAAGCGSLSAVQEQSGRMGRLWRGLAMSADRGPSQIARRSIKTGIDNRGAGT